ncbi:transglutaminase family protein [Nanoarchaeota archaeon]
MKEEDLIKEAEHALQELEKKRMKRGVATSEPDSSKKSPWAYLAALLLLLLIIMMVVPYYGIKVDPHPKNIPTISEVAPYYLKQLVNETPGIPKASRSDYSQLIIYNHQAIKTMAARIATDSCEGMDLCYAKAIFYFVRDNFKYVGDPPDDYLESPFETIYTRGADCDGLAILLANLESAIGVTARFAFIPGHAYVQVKIDSAPNKYKQPDDWISLDPTCKTCEFGEIPYSTENKQKQYLYI